MLPIGVTPRPALCRSAALLIFMSTYVPSPQIAHLLAFTPGPVGVVLLLRSIRFPQSRTRTRLALALQAPESSPRCLRASRPASARSARGAEPSFDSLRALPLSLAIQPRSRGSVQRRFLRREDASDSGSS